MPKRGKAAQNAARNQLNIEVKRTCVDVTLAVWLIGLASEKYLSTAITEMNVAEEMERKIVKNPWNWQNPSPNCHDCCERVTIENGITKTVIKNCVNDRPTRNKLLTVRIHVLGSTRHRIAVLVRAANTSRTDSKTTATILIFWTSTTVSMLFFFSSFLRKCSLSRTFHLVFLSLFYVIRRHPSQSASGVDYFVLKHSEKFNQMHSLSPSCLERALHALYTETSTWRVVQRSPSFPMSDNFICLLISL